jgi:acyl-coenzyme A thioesterase PaaI-like protein
VIVPPELEAPPGFVAIDTITGPQLRTFVSGDPDGRRLRIRYCWDESGRRFIARVWFGEHTEGPPGHVHGGCVAAVLDESMGTASWCFGHPAVAARIEVEFRRMVPIGTVASVAARLVAVDGRKISIAARLEGDDGTLYSESAALFIERDPEECGAYAEFARMTKEARLTRSG